MDPASRQHQDRVGGVDQLVRYRAQVGPIVTEVEDIQELPAGFQHRQLRRTDRHHGLFVVPVRVGVGNASWARFERCVWGEQLELVKMRSIPPSKRIVNSHGEPFECVLLRHGKDPTWARPQRRAAALDQFRRD